MAEKKTLTVELTPDEANLFCQFCSRSTFDTFKDLAQNRDEDEAYQMRDALYSIWHQLTN